MTNIIHCFFYPRHAFLMIRNNHNTIHRLKNLLEPNHNTIIFHLYS